MEDKCTKINFITGTKLALNNTQLLISSGIPTLDNLIGGGLPVGTVLLIEEDTCGIYSTVMLKYFLAEGAINGHSLYVASLDCDSSSLVRNMPSVILNDNDDDKLTITDINEDKLTIAWRYQNIQNNQPKLITKFGHYYDLTRAMDQSIIEKTDVTYWNPKDFCDKSSITFKNSAYYDILQNLKLTIEKQKLSLTCNPKRRNILRIALHSFGSPLWLPYNDTCNSIYQRDLDMFLYCLRALARSAFVVIAITIPSKIISVDSISRCIYSSDLAVRLQTFAGTELEKNSCLADYQGFFHFTKFSCINCLQNKDPGPIDYAFKMRRKKFTVELLHLPPDLHDTSQDDVPNISCGNSDKHLLEF